MRCRFAYLAAIISGVLASTRRVRGLHARFRMACGTSRFVATVSSANCGCRMARKSATFARADLPLPPLAISE